MLNRTFLSNSFTSIAAARPVSHLAAVTLLGTSIYAVHEGAAASGLPAGLVTATTAAMIGMEWLQWTALGRLARIVDAGEEGRAFALRAQCAGIGCLQVALYTIMVVNFAKQGGLDWSQGWALMGSIFFAALFAALNFIAKWTSCDAIGSDKSTGPTGGQRVHEAIFSTPSRPQLPSNDDNVVTFDLEKAIREKTARMEAAEASALQAAPPAREAKVRLRNAAKRIRMRAQRAAA